MFSFLDGGGGWGAYGWLMFFFSGGGWVGFAETERKREKEACMEEYKNNI